MELFNSYELQKDADGYILVLHIADSLTEFADDLGCIDNGQRGVAYKDIIKYVNEKFRNIKINSVQIIVGTLLVSSFSLNSAQAYAATLKTQSKTYSVRSGDTLSSISKRMYVSVNDIMKTNKLKSKSLKKGRKLKIPIQYYTVAAGDTISSISKKFNYTVAQIKKFNHLSTNKISPGTKLIIPKHITNQSKTVKPVAQTKVPEVKATTTAQTKVPKATATTDAQTKLPETTATPVDVAQSNSSTSNYYTVKAGDTLWEIAIKYGTTVDSIKAANNLSTDMIYIGRQLKLPVTKNTSQSSIMNGNAIPANTPSTNTNANTATDAKDTTSYSYYMIKPGDTLLSIANSFGITVSELKEANNFTTDLIYSNQRIRIPITEAASLTVGARGYATSMDITRLATLQKEKAAPVFYDFSKTQSSIWASASTEQLGYYLNPGNFIDDAYGKYQFLVLNYTEGITATDINDLLIGKGILEGKGDVFLEAAKANNISPIYLVSHALLETGEGSEVLAKGVLVSTVVGNAVEPKVVYNMFGINAFDINPIKYGSEYAYKQQWFSVEAAIIGGAKWISGQYINNPTYHQNTLYKMRWNPENPGTHQYSTDVSWAYNQTYHIKKLLDKIANAELVFDIPQ